ncbi:LysE family translocator [Marinomonas pollencensis]|uniref:Threonine/homoserine/homoserine lactone efflux protein n=1 Tax=Marinomonas pollencensis TaxID=491954 RepID=A0A3E0DPT7_9GAMM|nr:LysE family translocator [Marinomonas pollencensis]REG84262.1 threonine/homoserine/homoserine lactone efflux protein [Marinomonas pollencensis]
MEFATWLSLAAICTMGAISPGPSLAVILRVTLSQAPLHGMVAAITHGLGVGFWALLTMQGLAVLVTEHPTIFYFLSVAGGLYLAWLGVKSIRYAGKGNDIDTVALKSSYWESARDGLLVALMNPKAGLFFLALFSQYVQAEMAALVKLQLWATVVVIDGGWYILVALLLAGGPLLAWLRRHRVWVDRGMGCLLILLALKVILG